jgi:hypothetical protein
VATTADSGGRLSLILHGQRVAAAAAAAASPDAALRLWDVLVRLRGGRALGSQPAGPDGFGESIWAELTWFDSLLLPCTAGATVRRLAPDILRGLVRRQLESVTAPAEAPMVGTNLCEALPL